MASFVNYFHDFCINFHKYLSCFTFWTACMTNEKLLAYSMSSHICSEHIFFVVVILLLLSFNYWLNNSFSYAYAKENNFFFFIFCWTFSVNCFLFSFFFFHWLPVNGVVNTCQMNMFVGQKHTKTKQPG